MSTLCDPTYIGRSIVGIGGKALSLLQLNAICKVPEWFAVPSEIFADVLQSSGVGARIEELLKELSQENPASIADEIKELINAVTLPDDLINELGTMLNGNKWGRDYLSVRSSAADEDGKQHSFAGIHESYLYVKGIEQVCLHLRKVWASGYDPRALLYRRQNKLPLHPVPMAVIVQRMISAKISGVIFTADPTTQNPLKIVISSLYGLGEGLVSAGLEADHYTFDKHSRAISSVVAEKSRQILINKTLCCGVQEYDVEEELRNQASLSSDTVIKLADVALKIERFFGHPQDIEFCYDELDQLYILQSRDITTANEYGPAAGNHQIWDNSNIIESYSGVTSPMTFSFIRNAYDVVYRCFSEVMGIPRKKIEENEEVYQNMLGLFKGQVYYNLPNWYRLVKQFPGYNYNKSFMESMMGVTDKADADDDARHDSPLRRYFVELPQLLILAGRMILQFMALKWRVPAFASNFNRLYQGWCALDFSQMRPHELMQTYREMERKLLRKWKTPIINDFHVMIFYGTLKACCQKWCGDDKGTLQNNLICGEGGIASTEPTRMLMKLASDIKGNSQVKELFLQSSPADLVTAVPKYPECQKIYHAVNLYLLLYGFRCINELKLEEPSLHETPEFIYQMLINYIGMSDELLDIETMAVRERKIRSDSETFAFGKLSLPRRLLFKFVLKQARCGVKNRENLRFARTRIYGRIRQLLNAVGQTLVEEQVIGDDQDIYYLTMDEVWDYIKGTSVTTSLSALIELRKKEFTRYRDEPADISDHFDTYGMAYNRNSFVNHLEAKESLCEDGLLHGIGCSPGCVKGTARVVHSPKDDMRLSGEILVASRTDPGWVVLYPSVSGILIERGSILSHSAIVAREMGIPAIVGIPGLLDVVTDGSHLEVDATAGTVKQS